MLSASLSEFAKLIHENNKAFNLSFPKLSNAAEAVHQGGEAFSDCIKLSATNLKTYGAGLMFFGAHSAWMEAYVLSSAGNISTAWAAIRRAIEFSCYAFKVSSSQRRAEAWMKQRDDEKARSTFSSSCSIPLNYKNERYKLLRPLLVAYDIANYYGAHGNFESLIPNYSNRSDEELRFAYQSDKEYVPQIVGMIIILGYRILQVFREILNTVIFDYIKLDSVIKFVSDSVRDSRLDLLNRKYGKTIPDQIRRAIYLDDQSEIDRMFEEYIEKENKAKLKKAGVNRDIT